MTAGPCSREYFTRQTHGESQLTDELIECVESTESLSLYRLNGMQWPHNTSIESNTPFEAVSCEVNVLLQKVSNFDKPYGLCYHLVDSGEFYEHTKNNNPCVFAFAC